MGAESVRCRRLQAREIKTKIVERSSGRGRVYQKKAQIAAFLALAVTSLVIYLRFPTAVDPLDTASLSEEQKQELRALEPAVIANLTAGSPHRLGRFCDSGGDCFEVVQQYWMHKGLKAQRLIMYELNPKMALTMAFLKTPEIVTTHHAAAPERWPVDHARLTFSYNLMQIAAGFMLDVRGGLSFNRSESAQRVLQIGMGGGTATGYLATLPLKLHLDVVELEPAVYEAAKRWFDFPDSPNIKVHIMDGVVFAKEAAAKGITYDSFILDASSNSPNASIVCPHEVFLQEEVMAAMSKVVGAHGVFSVNLFMPEEQERLQEEVARKFSAHFANCFMLKILGNGQKFLLCTNRAGFDWASERARILANLAAFDDVMRTSIAPYIDRLNPVPTVVAA